MVNKFVSDFSYEKVQVNAVLEDALNKVDGSMCTGMDYGDEIELNAHFTLCKHTEEDFFWVVDTTTYDEVCDVVEVFPNAERKGSGEWGTPEIAFDFT